MTHGRRGDSDGMEEKEEKIKNVSRSGEDCIV